MQKYKKKYIFRYERDSEGKIYNQEDNFIACRSKGKIHRYNDNTLVFVSPKKIQLKKTDKEGNLIKDYTNLVLDIYDTDEERVITFKEENIEQLEDILKIRKRKKMSEETKEKARQRMNKIWANKNNNQNENSDENDDNEE